MRYSVLGLAACVPRAELALFGWTLLAACWAGVLVMGAGGGVPLPHSRRRAVLFPILYTATIMPFQIFFLGDTSSDPGWNAADVIISVLFGLDMIVSFNVGYYDSEGWPVNDRCVRGRVTCKRACLLVEEPDIAVVVGFRRPSIYRHYLRTFFIIDLVSLPPYSTSNRHRSPS